MTNGKKLDKIIEREQKKLLDKIFSLYPYLVDEKDNIINECINKKISESQNILQTKKEIILEQIVWDDKIFYKDNYGGILNDKAELVGTVSHIDDDGKIVCEMFEKIL